VSSKREPSGERLRGVPVRLAEDRRDLIQQAYDHRGADHGVEERLGMAVQLARRLARDDSAGWDVAMSLHLLAFTLSGQIPPKRLIALLDPPVTALSRRAVREPEMLRFAALLVRTVSMAANKADDYVAAFYSINRAHRLLGPAEVGRDRMTMEALQQIYLQESGQLARNAEVGLLELDRTRRIRLHDHGDRPRRRLNPGVLHQIRVLARASVSAGANASRIMAQLRTDHQGLPAEASADDDHLAVATWSVTANIMFMRALLLLATADFAAGKNGERRVDTIPYLYWQTVMTENVKFQTSHSMDLTRVALHYSFLVGGKTPYRRAKVKGRKLADAVPEYLTDTNPMLDITRCSYELIKANHDAGILDNIAFSEVHNILQKHSSQHYEPWLQRHRTDRTGRTGDVDVQLRLASAGPELDALDYTSRMVERTRRYADASGLGCR